MARYLSADWHASVVDAAASYPEREGADAVLMYCVSGTPEGDIKYVQTILGGRVASQALGESKDADVTLTTTWEDSIAMCKGELDPSVAFMQGRLKAAGHIGRLFSVLPLSLSDEYRSAQAALLAQTEF